MKRFLSLTLAVAFVLSSSALGTFATENDFDGDGLTDQQETYNKTNPKVSDTDSDGLTDGEEVNVYYTNPTKDDSDNDGLKDREEIFTYKTNPNKLDTDGDGLSDFSEVKAYSTNPLNADTDEDGLTDQDEIVKHKTDPLNPDSDKDGLKDGSEYMAGYDPLELNHPYLGGVKCDSPEIQSIYYGSTKVYPFGQGAMKIDPSANSMISFEFKNCPYDGITYNLEFDGDNFADKNFETLSKNGSKNSVSIPSSEVLDTFYAEFEGTNGEGTFRVVTSTGAVSKKITIEMDFAGYVPGVDYTAIQKPVKEVVKKPVETVKKPVAKKKKIVLAQPAQTAQVKVPRKLNASGNPEAVFQEIAEEKMVPSFLDTGGHWAANAIEKLRRLGLVNGKSNRQFEPNAPITRAELVTMAMKGFNHNVGKYHDVKVFKDVNVNDYYASSVAAAYDLGIITGYEDDTFRPDRFINRAEAVKILMLAAGVRVSGDEVTGRFSDVSADAWYMPYIAKSEQNRIVRGYYNTDLFGPQNNMTRGETSSVIYQIIAEFYSYI